MRGYSFSIHARRKEIIRKYNLHPSESRNQRYNTSLLFNVTVVPGGLRSFPDREGSSAVPSACVQLN